MPFFRFELARLALVGIAGAGCSFDWALPASPGAGGGVPGACCECDVADECEESAAGSRRADFSCGCELAADCAANVRGKAGVAVDLALEECGCAADSERGGGETCEGAICPDAQAPHGVLGHCVASS